MAEKKDFVKRLDRGLKRYADYPDTEPLLDLLSLLFEGIDMNCALPCPVEMDLDELTGKPMFLVTADGKEHLAVLTRQDKYDFRTTAQLRLQALVRLALETDNCDGIVFNPHTMDRLVIPTKLLENALSAGRRMARAKGTAKKKSGVDFSSRRAIRLRRPMEYRDFEKLEDRIRGLSCDPDDFIIVDLVKDKDELLFMQTIRHDELWYVELAYDMRDFGKKVPLILGAEMSLEEAVKLFEMICVRGMSPDDIPMVQDCFRDIGFRGPDDAGED